MARRRLDQLADLEFVRNPNAPPSDDIYHLADGIILSIGPRTSRLLDLDANDDIKVDFRYVEVLEQLGRGTNLTGYESSLPLMLQTGVIEQGPAKSDATLRGRLEQLDGYYMGRYREALSDRELDAYHATLEVHARRKRFFQQVGQCAVLPETSLRRALHVGDAEHVGRKEILCLGDDDLVSVALARLGHSVTVYDIDDYLLDFLRLASKDLGLGLTIEEVDLRDPLRKTQRERFDVVLTDPMSNRDCFELFLSRAFSMLKTGGQLFSACFPPTVQLFHEVANEMRFPILRWHARHNRYYTDYFKLHWYESDWVETTKTEETQVKVAAEDFCVPLNLYREDFYQRLPMLVAEVAEIEEERFTRPMYLDLLFDALEQETAHRLRERSFFAADRWSMGTAETQTGRLTIHADRERKEIVVDLFPFVPELERPLRGFLMNVFKPKPSDIDVTTSNAVWSLRLR
ncbi:MAG: bis-aminopropyl spermidine synthase family protein [Myxococcota bacterium]